MKRKSKTLQDYIHSPSVVNDSDYVADNEEGHSIRIYLPPESIESYIKLTTPLKLEISNYIYF